MGKKAKIGKHRKDKFYNLAKESGYRARSAFKLLQLNRKFQFLETSRVCIDLCAAPGGWLQVAAEKMPISSLVVGVDLVPIKPIRNCTTFVGDITTDTCRTTLRKHLQTWKADCVLNDGAPNVGGNWSHEAFTQNQLTLSAAKLASEFLRAGGIFVTKIFRSKDYNALVWVLQQLFTKVHATKPAASRQESAEIFVVCVGFKAPGKIDPKFFDPRAVFQEVETEKKETDLFRAIKKPRKNREGYADDVAMLFSASKAKDFVTSTSYAQLLANSNELIIEDDWIGRHPLTTNEVRQCCADVKVLGKRELKLLLTWRKKLQKSWSAERKEERIASGEVPDVPEEAEKVDEEEDEETRVQAQIAELQMDEKKRLKKRMKKIRREKIELNKRINMKMVQPDDEPLYNEEVELFSLRNPSLAAAMSKPGVEKPEEAASRHYDRGEGRADLHNAVENAAAGDSDDEWSEEEDELHSDFEAEKVPHHTDNLLVDLDGATDQARMVDLWYQKDSFKEWLDSDEDDLYLEELAPVVKVKQSRKRRREGEPVVEDGDLNDTEMDKDKVAEEYGNDSSDDSDYDDVALRKEAAGDKRPMTAAAAASVNTPKIPKLDAVGLAIGTKLAVSARSRRQMIEAGYNRYTFDDTHLAPEWFREDEKKHSQPTLPVTKAEVDAQKARLLAADARPIKKVMEAKARKKTRLVTRMETARKKSEAVQEVEGVSDAEKWSQVKSIYRKAKLQQKQAKTTYVVAKKGGGKKAPRPKGVKGKFKVVDSRLKKDTRAQKASDKRKKGAPNKRHVNKHPRR